MGRIEVPGLVRPPSRYLTVYKRSASQVGVFPGSNVADFDEQVLIGPGARRTSAGIYTLIAGVWRVTAQVMLQLAATATRPRVQLFSSEGAGTFPFHQEFIGLDTTAPGSVASFSVYALVRVKAKTELSLTWETDTAGSDLYVPGGLGCTLQLERLP